MGTPGQIKSIVNREMFIVASFGYHCFQVSHKVNPRCIKTRNTNGKPAQLCEAGYGKSLFPLAITTWGLSTFKVVL
jgi:hypothetical protein